MDTPVKGFMLGLVISAICFRTVCSKEYDVCLWNKLNATCGEKEVIKMEEAKYGRMSVGPCIRESHRMGCQKDVLNYLDSVCSGRQSCQLRLSDYLTGGPQPCELGLTSYLHVRYICTPVYVSPIPCSADPLPAPGIQGVLANLITEQTGQGSADCPWEVRGLPGQRVRLTIQDYGVWTPSSSLRDTSIDEDTGIRPTRRSDICHIYAKVTEGTTRNPITLCGDDTRDKEIYLSKTDSVHIAITNPKHTTRSAYFLLRYEIIGCPNYIPPKGALITQHENGISVRCTHTGSQWRLSCNGTHWLTESNTTICTGTVGEPAMSIETVAEWSMTWPQGILIMIIISIAILIAVLILVIGIVSLRRKRETLVGTRSNLELESEQHTLPQYTSKERYPMLPQDERTRHSVIERGYTTTLNRQMAVPPGAVRNGRELPPLPLPPTTKLPDAGNCTLHGTQSHDRFPQGRRRDFRNHFYHELDPEHIQNMSESPRDQPQSGHETLDRVGPVEPPPDLCPPSLCESSGVDKTNIS